MDNPPRGAYDAVSTRTCAPPGRTASRAAPPPGAAAAGRGRWRTSPTARSWTASTTAQAIADEGELEVLVADGASDDGGIERLVQVGQCDCQAQLSSAKRGVADHVEALRSSDVECSQILFCRLHPIQHRTGSVLILRCERTGGWWRPDDLFGGFCEFEVDNLDEAIDMAAATARGTSDACISPTIRA